MRRIFIDKSRAWRLDYNLQKVISRPLAELVDLIFRGEEFDPVQGIDLMDKVRWERPSTFASIASGLLRICAAQEPTKALACMLDYASDEGEAGRPWRPDPLCGLRLRVVEEGEKAPGDPWKEMKPTFHFDLPIHSALRYFKEPGAVRLLTEHSGDEQLFVCDDQLSRRLMTKDRSTSVGRITPLMDALVSQRIERAAHLLKIFPDCLDHRSSNGYTVDDLVAGRQVLHNALGQRIEIPNGLRKEARISGAAAMLVLAARAAQRAREAVKELTCDQQKRGAPGY